VAVGLPRAIVKVDAWRLPGSLPQRFQPSEKRCDADAARDPDLRRVAAAATEIEAAVRAFDQHGLPRMQTGGEATRVIAKRLDLKGDAAVAAVGRRDRKRMVTFDPIKGDESELTGTMPAPPLVE